MTIPVYVLGAISLVIQIYLSDKFKRRALFIIGSCIPVAVGYLICVGTPNPHAGYAGMFILVLGKLLCLKNPLSPRLILSRALSHLYIGRHLGDQYLFARFQTRTRYAAGVFDRRCFFDGSSTALPHRTGSTVYSGKFSLRGFDCCRCSSIWRIMAAVETQKCTEREASRRGSHNERIGRR
jgi:hypothetical protein